MNRSPGRLTRHRGHELITTGYPQSMSLVIRILAPHRKVPRCLGMYVLLPKGTVTALGVQNTVVGVVWPPVGPNQGGQYALKPTAVHFGWHAARCHQKLHVGVVRGLKARRVRVAKLPTSLQLSSTYPTSSSQTNRPIYRPSLASRDCRI